MLFQADALHGKMLPTRLDVTAPAYKRVVSPATAKAVLDCVNSDQIPSAISCRAALNHVS